jgi:hypothetical protein
MCVVSLAERRLARAVARGVPCAVGRSMHPFSFGGLVSDLLGLRLSPLGYARWSPTARRQPHTPE